MPNIKLVANGIRVIGDKKGKPIQIITTTVGKDKPKACKFCRKNPRLSGSSGCKDCRTLRIRQRLTSEKLARRIG